MIPQSYEPDLRGMAFANYAAESLLAKIFIKRGFTVQKDSQTWDKDFGDGAVAYFDCGEVTFTKGDVKYHLYQSRFSDNWALDGPYGRLIITQYLTDRVNMNDALFVDALMKEMDSEPS